MHHAKHTGRPADSDFEIAVMRTLGEHGYECEPQLGVAGYYLDLAVRDPGQPGHFLMGVECDGATYHSAKSTRDRDRLRQDILENLGWRIRRIWSTDWFKNPQAQIQPIIQELDKLKTPVLEMPVDVVEESSVDEFQLDSSDLTEESYEESYGESYEENFEDGVDLKSRLLDLKENIQESFSETDDDRRLLRPAMIEAILNHLPCSKAEFLETIPNYLRTGTDIDEAQKYLETVLEIVSDYG
jgi:very-short-patch-repair endonuclease